MSIILRYLKILYLIDGTAQKKPVHAVEEDDTHLLYMCLHRKLDENGKDLIAEHSGDSVKAWKAFNKRFGQADTGTTIDKFCKHISTRRGIHNRVHVKEIKRFVPSDGDKFTNRMTNRVPIFLQTHWK